MYESKAVFLDPSLGSDSVVQSNAQIVTKYSELGGFITDLRDDVVNINALGANKVVVEFVSSGKDTAGNAFRLPICTIFTISNGKIVKDFTYYDN